MKRTFAIHIGISLAILGSFFSINAAAGTYQAFGRIVGLHYETRGKGNAPTPDQIQQDLSLINQMAKTIRLSAESEEQDLVLQIAAQEELRVVLVAKLGPDLAANDAEIDRLIAIARSNANVAFVCVGQEALLRGYLNKEQLLELISRARQSISVPVTTIEPWTVWRDNSDLVSAVDLIFVPASPYLEGEPIESSVAFVTKRHSYLKTKYPGKPVIISDTGWPSEGPIIGQAVPAPKISGGSWTNFQRRQTLRESISL